MKFAKHFFLCLFVCLLTFIANAWAGPKIIVLRESVNAKVKTSLYYNNVCRVWEESYNGSAYVDGAFRSLNFYVQSKIEPELSDYYHFSHAGFTVYQYNGRSRLGGGTALGWGGSLSSFDKYRHEEKNALLMIDWSFTVQGGNLNAIFEIDSWPKGRSELELLDETTGKTVVYLRRTNDHDSKECVLADTHVYRLTAFAICDEGADPTPGFCAIFDTEQIVFAGPRLVKHQPSDPPGPPSVDPITPGRFRE